MAALSPSRGEIWWYEPPDEKPRPVLVLTRNAAIDVLSRVLAVPATRSVRDIPTHVRLDESDGMPQACALTLDNMGPVAKSLLTRHITSLAPAKMSQICAALDVATEC